MSKASNPSDAGYNDPRFAGSTNRENLDSDDLADDSAESCRQLRGAGAITEVEGAKATQAISRLDTGLSGPEFDKALNDLEGVIRNGITRAKMKASYGAGTVAPGGSPIPQPPAGFVIQQ